MRNEMKALIQSVVTVKCLSSRKHLSELGRWNT